MIQVFLCFAADGDDFGRGEAEVVETLADAESYVRDKRNEYHHPWDVVCFEPVALVTPKDVRELVQRVAGLTWDYPDDDPEI